MHEKPVIGQIKVLAQTRIFRIESVSLTFSNGEQREFERVNNPNAGAVMVIPVIGNELIMVREYAVGSEQYELGFVKGLIDPGETPQQAANRELKEEIGHGAHAITYVRETRATPHYNSARAHLLLAEDLYTESLPGDEPEALQQLRWPLDDLDGLLAHPEINDVRSLHAIYWLQSHLNNTPDNT